MPKLNAAVAKAVDSAEAVHGGGDFEPHPEGLYLARLSDVSVRDETNKHGAAQWSAEFQNLHSIETQQPVAGRQWLELTLPLPKNKVPSTYEKDAEKWAKYQDMVQGRLKAFFEAFGYTVDSDTDEMLNEWAIIRLSIRTVQQGKNEGKLQNRVEDIEALPEDFDFEAFGITEPGEDEAF